MAGIINETSAVPSRIVTMLQDEIIINPATPITIPKGQTVVLNADWLLGNYKGFFLYAFATFAAGSDGDLEIQFCPKIPTEEAFSANVWGRMNIAKNIVTPFQRPAFLDFDAVFSSRRFQVKAYNKNTAAGSSVVLNKLYVTKVI